jgi:hypothetical protein
MIDMFRNPSCFMAFQGNSGFLRDNQTSCAQSILSPINEPVEWLLGQDLNLRPSD